MSEGEDKVLAALAALQASLDAMRADMDGVRDDMGTMRADVAAVGAHAAGGPAGADSLQDGVQRFGAALGRTAIKLDRLARGMNTMRPRLSALQTDTAYSLVTAASLQSRMDHHETRLSRVEREIELRGL